MSKWIVYNQQLERWWMRNTKSYKKGTKTFPKPWALDHPRPYLFNRKCNKKSLLQSPSTFWWPNACMFAWIQSLEAFLRIWKEIVKDTKHAQNNISEFNFFIFRLRTCFFPFAVEDALVFWQNGIGWFCFFVSGEDSWCKAGFSCIIEAKTSHSWSTFLWNLSPRFYETSLVLILNLHVWTGMDFCFELQKFE